MIQRREPASNDLREITLVDPACMYPIVVIEFRVILKKLYG